MSTWNKIVATKKLVFGGWESVLDYVLGILNKYLKGDNVKENVEKAYDTAHWVCDWMHRLRDWCPEKWRAQYDAVYDAVYALVDVFADGEVTTGEVTHCIEVFKDAYATWQKED